MLTSFQEGGKEGQEKIKKYEKKIVEKSEEGVCSQLVRKRRKTKKTSTEKNKKHERRKTEQRQNTEESGRLYSKSTSAGIVVEVLLIYLLLGNLVL